MITQCIKAPHHLAITLFLPRVSPSLPSTNGSPFSHLFSDPVGIDPYTIERTPSLQSPPPEGGYEKPECHDPGQNEACEPNDRHFIPFGWDVGVNHDR